MNTSLHNSPQIRSLCVYCGSSSGSSTLFSAAAQQLGQELAKAGVRLVYGGGNNGLMGTLSRSVLLHGGQVTGIIPEFLKNREVMLNEVQEAIVVPDMHTRKRLMFEKADAFVALPGGIGTLEELVEQLTWAQLGRHKKPILLANIDQFWSPLLTLMDHMQATGFLHHASDMRYLVADDIGQILPLLEDFAAKNQNAVKDSGLNPAL